MARYYGAVGYGIPYESAPGVWKDEIVEEHYRGDVVRDTRKLEADDKINSDISVGNSISIIANKFAVEHYHLIKYVEWTGTRWTVSKVDVQRPRLILSIGKRYNGPTP